MNNLTLYLSQFLWQLLILWNFIMELLNNLIHIIKHKLYLILYYYYPPYDIIFVENSRIKFGGTYENFFNLTLHSFDYLVFNIKSNNLLLKTITTSLEDLPIYQDPIFNQSLIPKPSKIQFIMVLFKILIR